MRLRSFISALIILVLFPASSRSAAFDLPAGDATIRLLQWSESAGIQILFDFNVARLYETRAVRGSMSPQLAMIRMLSGTNLTFEWINDHTITVEEAQRICRPDGGLPVREIPLPPCIQGPGRGEKKLVGI